MAMSTPINQALAAGASVTSGAMALTAPVSGVELILSTQWAAASAAGIYLTYQVSLDGTTYSDPMPTHLSPASTDTSTHIVQGTISVPNGADVKFTVVNRDPKNALTNVTLQAIQF